MKFSLQICISELEVKKLTVTEIRIKQLIQSAVLFGNKYSIFFCADYRIYFLQPFFRTEWSFVKADAILKLKRPPEKKSNKSNEGWTGLQTWIAN